MTQQIKPKQCGENNWYIPNQKGFVPKVGGGYFLHNGNGVSHGTHSGSWLDYALIDSGNCFETGQEALDAFVKPVDPTPLTWDELCEIGDEGGYPYTLGHVSGFNNDTGEYVGEMCFTEERADDIRSRGRILFEAHKWWRSLESIKAWIDKQKGELNER